MLKKLEIQEEKKEKLDPYIIYKNYFRMNQIPNHKNFQSLWRQHKESIVTFFDNYAFC